MSRANILAIALVSFLAGTFLGPDMDPRSTRILFYLAACTVVMLSTVFWKNRSVLATSFVLIAFAAGAWHYQSSLPVINDKHVALYNDQGMLEWEGVVVKEPEIRRADIRLVVSARSITVPEDKSVQGRVLLTVPRFPEYKYGDLINVKSELETPFESEEFSYRNYLSVDHIYSVSRYPKSVVLVGHNKANAAMAALLRVKQELKEKIQSIIPEPESALLLGLLVGSRESIPERLKELFEITSMTHIVAISGFNISIITRMVGAIIQKQFGPKVALIAGGSLVTAFVIFTGASPSVIRAGIMGMLVVMALTLGRSAGTVRTLVLAAALMAALNPSIVRYDVGFQLSCLATLGLLINSDWLSKRMRSIPDVLELRTTAVATISAHIFVLPLLVHYFGRFSLVSLPANLLVLPVIPWTMLFGFISVCLGFVWLPLGYLAGWITWAFLAFEIKMIEWLGDISFASIAVGSIPVTAITVYFIILAAVSLIIYERERNSRIYNFRKFKS